MLVLHGAMAKLNVGRPMNTTAFNLDLRLPQSKSLCNAAFDLKLQKDGKVP
jgi:hypothetical protein